MHGMGASANSKKRCRTAVNDMNGFKKDYDALPSKLSERPPSSLKSKPYHSMIASWWLEQNPEFKGLNDGGEWGVGFRSCLKDEELHEIDWEHIKELTMWHEEQEQEREREKEKQRERQNRGAVETQPLAGPSSLVL